MKKKQFDFCFIISDLLSTTPRAYRSIKALLENGYSVYLVCNVRRFHAYKTHKELIDKLANYKFSYSEIFWEKWNLRTLFFKILQKLSLILYKKRLNKSRIILNLAFDFSILWQKFVARNISAKIYAGHRPACLPIINYLAQKHQTKAWFDIEDFHFEESTDIFTNQLTSDFLTNQETSFYTDASELIGKAFLKRTKSEKTSIEILNSPDFKMVSELKKNESPVFLWFSQFVSFNRGLEFFLEELQKMPTKSVLHIVGQTDELFLSYLRNLNISNCEIKIHGYIAEEEIWKLACSADIGLALEPNNTDESRNLAITNKILTYCNAGLYVWYTQTNGQLNFMQRLKKTGTLVNKKTLPELLLQLPQNLEIIRNERNLRLQISEIVSWKKQREKLLQFLNENL